MKLTLQDRLLRRDLGNRSRYSSIKGIYGDKSWIGDLDIVNELGGHSGCVNALRYASLQLSKPSLTLSLQLVYLWKTLGIWE